MKTEILVIGSGAGGATTAWELANAGADVLVAEEGSRHSRESYGRPAPDAMRQLYRRRGMTPIMGSVPIGYVEGRCLGGSTEINSAFWHRTPPDVLDRWTSDFELQGVDSATMATHFDWLERELFVAPYHAEWPLSTAVFHDGAAKMGWTAVEVPRVVRSCDCRTPCSSGCYAGGKQSMSRSLLPKAESQGARVVTDCRVIRLLRRGRRIVGAEASITREAGRHERIRIEAEHVFACCGPTETPALLLRSGIRRNIGKQLQIHPMLKIAARFPYDIGAWQQPIPLLQINDVGADITLGGAHFSAGHLAMHLSENWPALGSRMQDMNRMAMFHVAVKGTGQGSVARSAFNREATHLRYAISDRDHRALTLATAALSQLLLSAGADEVYPAIHNLPLLTSASNIHRELDRLSKRALSLTTVHAFATCPIGERRDRTAANSFGRVWEHDNLFVNDASMLPGSPGVNPQGSIMALARRNAQYFNATVR